MTPNPPKLDQSKVFGEYEYWFAQNKDFDDKNIISIPIGLENMFLRNTDSSQNGKFSSEVKGAAYKGSLIDKYSSFNVPKQGLAYLNFNIETAIFLNFKSVLILNWF